MHTPYMVTPQLPPSILFDNRLLLMSLWWIPFNPYPTLLKLTNGGSHIHRTPVAIAMGAGVKVASDSERCPRSLTGYSV